MVCQHFSSTITIIIIIILRAVLVVIRGKEWAVDVLRYRACRSMLVLATLVLDLDESRLESDLAYRGVSLSLFLVF